MKKLMITAAALLTACVVGAATDRERASGTDFESYPLGALSLDYDEDGLSQGTYWSSDQLGESEVKEESEGGNKFLAIDESVPLYRNMYKSNENKQPATVDVEQSVYFSSQVKFTASEDASMTPNPGDKLIVWLRSVDGEGPTNLIVTAYNSAEEEAQDYVIDNKTISDDAFHTLDIVASADDGAVKFTVSVDGTVLSSGGVTEFQSLVRSGSEKATITCAGFKGSGGIDDIEFGTIEENPTKYYEVDGEQYITIDEALAAAASAQNPTIKLINNAVLVYDDEGGAGYSNPAGNELTIDLAGYTISCEGPVFYNAGTLTIVDSSLEGAGAVVNTLFDPDPVVEPEDEPFSVVNMGSLNVSGGKFWGAVFYDDQDSSTEPVVTLNGDPAELVLDEDSTSETYGYWVIQASEEPPAPTVVQIPTAESDLVYDGTVQTGVEAGTGYTLTGNTGTNAGDYTATATLEEGYIWSDDTTVAKTINWSIAKAQVTATVSLTVTSATYDSEKTVVTDYTTPSFNFGLDAPELVENTDYTVAWSATEVTGAGTFTYTVSPVLDSNYTFTETSATLTITEGSEYPSYIDGITDPTEKAAYEAKYDTWATTYSVADGAGNEEAFLLNCAPANVETAKANFKIPSITVDAQGNVTVGEIEGTFNGKLQLKGSTDLKNWTNLNAASKDYNFFKYELTY